MVTSINVEGLDLQDTPATAVPLLMGGRAAVSEPTSVDDGDVQYLQVDTKGRMVIIPNAPTAPAGPTQGPATVTLTTSANVVLVAAPGTDMAVLVATVQCSIENTGSVIEIIFKEGTGGAPRLRFKLKDNGIYPPFSMTPAWKLSANTALVAQRVSGSVDVVINYHFYVEES